MVKFTLIYGLPNSTVLEFNGDLTYAYGGKSYLHW